jgi:serine/threonine protein kinase
MAPSMPDIRSGGGTYFLGRYRVVDEIGIGGMASVHLARMDGPGGFQKWVAIKKIHPHLVEDESFVQMFLDEARVAARISHPNVATVFDLGKHEDTYWIAMEYLHGEPLREVMRRTEELGTAMPPEIACRVIADAAEGLHAAHELLGKNGEKLGLVHRDVTPHNLFVTYDGVTKVVDFGIAKFSSRANHTRAGTLKGKLAYMSPEQVHGEVIDRRTDIFALGVVLWELTTGQRLFRMESDLDTLAKVQECNVQRPSTLIRGYPVDLEKIVMKALAKNRGERFRTARELSRALQSLLMRRGLFIASDEVAAYVQSIFTDRIQKREAHLRWAAEVTQTINVDQMLSKPKIGPEFTNSEIQASQSGRPPPTRGPMPSMKGPLADPSPQASQPPHAPQSRVPPTAMTPQMPPELKETGPTNQLAPRTQASPRPSAGRAPIAAPRPAAGAPPSLAPRPPQPPPEPAHDDHPSDGDGPTIQALPPMMDGAQGGASRQPLRSEPPTMAQGAAAPADDGPTMMAGPGARAAMMAGPEPMPIEPELEPEEDQDETMVAKARGAPNPLKSPPMFPQPPAAGRSDPPAPRPNATQPAQRFGQITALSPQVPPPQPQAPPQPQPQPYAMPSHSSDGVFAETMGMPGQPPPLLNDPNDYTRNEPAVPPQYRQGNPDFMMMPQPAPSNRMGVPTMNPRNGQAWDNRTGTALAYKRRPPMWVVAALSCSIALLIAGVVIAIVSSTSSGPTPPRVAGGGTAATSTAMPGTTTTAGAMTTAGTVATPTPVAVPAPGTGPFSTTRADLDKAMSGPSSALTPQPTAAPTTPPVMTAATDTAPSAPTATATAAPTATATPTATEAPAATATATAAPVATHVPTARPTPQPVPVPVAKPKSDKLGAITVVCMPKCDQIVDNGTPLGPGHIFNRPVPSGRHTLGLSAPNGVKKNLVVEVAPEQTREVRISMDR